MKTHGESLEIQKRKSMMKSSHKKQSLLVFTRIMKEGLHLRTFIHQKGQEVFSHKRLTRCYISSLVNHTQEMTYLRYIKDIILFFSTKMIVHIKQRQFWTFRLETLMHHLSLKVKTYLIKISHFTVKTLQLMTLSLHRRIEIFWQYHNNQAILIFPISQVQKAELSLRRVMKSKLWTQSFSKAMMKVRLLLQ